MRESVFARICPFMEAQYSQVVIVTVARQITHVLLSYVILPLFLVEYKSLLKIMYPVFITLIVQFPPSRYISISTLSRKSSKSYIYLCNHQKISIIQA